GALPGFLLYKILQLSLLDNETLFLPLSPYHDFIPFLGLLIPIFSALRLAKFNIDTRQSDQFIGLPTPANAFFIVGIAYLYSASTVTFSFLVHPYLLIAYCFVLPALLVAELPLLALKFK